VSERQVSRRRLLTAVAGVGGIGAATGVGTNALLRRDRGITGSTFATGTVDLRVGWAADGRSGTSEGTASFGLELAPEETETVDLTLTLPGEEGNPVYGWLRTVCTGTGSDLADELTVTLGYGRAGETLFEGPLAADELAAGLPLDADRRAHVSPGEQQCLGPDAALDLTLDVSLGNYWEPDTVGFALEVVGVQCRNTEGVRNPFEGAASPACERPSVDRYGISYVEIFVAEDGETRPLAKLELPDSYVEPGTYPIRDGDSETSGYELTIANTRTKGDGEEAETTGVAFEVRGPDGVEPTLARVDVKGGPDAVTYTDDTGALVGNQTNGVLSAPRRHT
jgi:hypothetical protein